MEASLRCLKQAGVERQQGMAALGPLVTGTAANVFANVFARGTVEALTGLIARGNDQTVARHLEAIAAWDPAIAALQRAAALPPGQGSNRSTAARANNTKPGRETLPAPALRRDQPADPSGCTTSLPRIMFIPHANVNSPTSAGVNSIGVVL